MILAKIKVTFINRVLLSFETYEFPTLQCHYRADIEIRGPQMTTMPSK